MTRIYVIAEGQSEAAFINKIIAPSLITKQIYIQAILIESSKGNKGGAISFERFLHFASNLIKQDKKSYISTMFDFYGLDTSFPIQEISNISNIEQKAEYIEKFMLQAVIEKTQCRPERFIPYIQLHELEGLFFADVEKLCLAEPDWKKYIPQLQEITNNFDSPEHINNNKETAPYKRLEKILVPKYRKTRHTPIIAKNIGLDTIEKKCEHFHNWLEKLRRIN